MFENHRKSLIQHSERSEQLWQKFIKNAKNRQFWRLFENLKLAVKQCYQTGQFQSDINWWNSEIHMKRLE